MKKIILDPHPRKKEEIFSTSSLKMLNSKYNILEFNGVDRQNFYKMEIKNVSYIIGQPKLDKYLLKKCNDLKAIFNVFSDPCSLMSGWTIFAAKP